MNTFCIYNYFFFLKKSSASQQLEKEYVCRVEGGFPEEEVICEQPILVVSFKIGLCRVDPKGKECRTVFQRLSFNGKTSVVRCLPVTGRTHQIRVHLQYLGFPILNDPIYGSSAWGPHRGKGGLLEKSDEELLKALVEEHRSQENLHLLDIPDDACEREAEPNKTSRKADKSDGAAEASAECRRPRIDSAPPAGLSSSWKTGTGSVGGCTDANINVSEKPPAETNGSPPEVADWGQTPPPGSRDHLCSECGLVRPDPTQTELIMYLHALRYKGPDFEYSTRLPEWAKEEWLETGSAC